MLARLTTCEQALCKILSDAHLRAGFSDMSHDEAASRIGCCKETVKRGLNTLRRFGWIEVRHRPVAGQKHKTNIVRIVAEEWLLWLRHGPRPRSQAIGAHSWPPTGNHLILKGGASRRNAPETTAAPVGRTRDKQPAMQEEVTYACENRPIR
jgi:hypothetical protein